MIVSIAKRNEEDLSHRVPACSNIGKGLIIEKPKGSKKKRLIE